MSLLGNLPYDVIRADGIITEIESSFVLPPSALCPFKSLEAELAADILRDPFETTIGADFSSDGFVLSGFSEWDDPLSDEALGESDIREKTPRSPSLYPYEFGNVFEANWYLKYLAPDVREKTYALSERDRYGEFRCHFRLPLKKVDELVSKSLDEG